MAYYSGPKGAYWALHYAVDVVEPPSGGYSFVEWDDLDPDNRLVVATRTWGWSSGKYGVPATHLMIAAEESKSLPVLRDVLDQLLAKKATDDEDLQKSAAGIEDDYRRSQGWLKADPHEIQAILKATEQGTIGREVTVPYFVPAFTCGWYDGSFRPVTPGNMVNAITASNAEPKVSSKTTGAEKSTYRVRIFVKP